MLSLSLGTHALVKFVDEDCTAVIPMTRLVKVTLANFGKLSGQTKRNIKRVILCQVSFCVHSEALAC